MRISVYYKNIVRKAPFFALIFSLSSSVCWASDYFNWSTRTDRDGKPAGIYATTPFPITESSSTYSIINDEGIETFTLGTIYFVDGTLSETCSGSYNPATRACSSGTYTAYKTIRAALSSVSAGNKTILVRDGTYNEYGLSLRAGADSAHRYMLCGYNQERPIINGTTGASTSYTIDCDAMDSTLQRIRLQNHCFMHIRAGGTRNYLIDVDVFNGTQGLDGASNAQGNIYAAGSNGLWIYHCTIDKCYGHAVKISDGARNSLVEWSVVSRWAYGDELETNWTGHVVAGNHPYGLDYADTGFNHTIRYNIVHTGCWAAIQVRSSGTAGNLYIHHNEFYDASNSSNIIGEGNGTDPALIFFNTSHSGTVYVYSNILRNVATADRAYGIYLSSQWAAIANYIYNNLFYDHRDTPIYARLGAGPTYFYNNSCYANSSGTILSSGLGSGLYVRNNIFYQAGSGSCVSLGSAGKNNNLYYYPYGSRGYTGALEAGGVEPGSQNFWAALPFGEYSPTESALTSTSSAVDVGASLGSPYNIDANLVSRPQGPGWDMGAYEFVGDPVAPSSPKDLRLLQ